MLILKKIGDQIKRRWFFLLLLLFTVHTVYAETIVKGIVDRNYLRPNDTFTFSVQITSDESVNIESVSEPNWPSFSVQGKWTSVERRGTIIGGSMQTQISQIYNYQMQANEAGKFDLDGVTVVIDGVEYRTGPLKINVEVGANPPVGRAQQQQIPGYDDDADPFAQMDQMFSQMLRRRLGRGVPQGAAIDPTDAFFIDVEVDKDKVFQGEQVLASFYLYTRAQIADIDTLKYPALSGFWKEDIELATRLNFQPVVVKGVQYNRALLAAYALFPITAGNSAIDEYQAKCRVITINSLGMPADQAITKESQRIPIQVLALPEAQRPTSYTGGVGSYQVSARLETKVVKSNQPMVLKVRIDGEGLAKLADFPKLQWPSEIEAYGDIKSDSKFFKNGQSFKEFEVLLIPRKEGAITIPEIEFGFFNPETKEYYVRKTEPIELNVLPGSPEEAIPEQTLKIAKEKNEEKTLPPAMEIHEEVVAQSFTGLWSGAFSSVLIVILVSLIRLFKPKDRKVEMRQQVLKELGHLNKCVNQNDYRSLGRKGTQLLSSTLGEVVGQGGASLTLDKLIELAPPSLRNLHGENLGRLSAKLEILAFAPEDMVMKEKGLLVDTFNELNRLALILIEYDYSEDKA